jgi:hypothetical protein
VHILKLLYITFYKEKYADVLKKSSNKLEYHEKDDKNINKNNTTTVII